MRSTFGGSKTITPVPPKRAPTSETDKGIPWEWDEDAVECDAAAADLLDALPRRLTLEGRVHAETCLAAIGAIAGLAAQRALFQQLTEQEDRVALGQIRNGRTRTGLEYFSGEALNRMLVPPPGAKTGWIWPLMVAGALRAGLPARHLPDTGEMFAHVARCLAGDGEGRPSIPEHQPHMTGRETLQIVWPLAMDCFLGRAPGMFPHKPTAMRRWPAIAGCVAGDLIQEMARVLHPRTGLIIVMESAIYASKIRPASVYAARPAPPPSLSERLEGLSASPEGGENPRRPAADPEQRRAGMAAPVEDAALAQQLAYRLHEQFM